MSHHFDTKLAKEDPSLNVCDLYLFQGAPDTTVMAMTVNPDVVLSAPDTLHIEGLYAFRLDLTGDAREDVVFKFRFNEPRHVNGDEHVHVQKFQVRRATGEAVGGDKGELLIEGDTGKVHSKSGIRAFVGIAPDMFAVDAVAFHNLQNAFYNEHRYDGDSFLRHRQNFFNNRNITAIVLEVPNHLIGKGTVHAWATVSLYGHAPEMQVSRWGLPLITHLFLNDPGNQEVKETYNKSVPSDDIALLSGYIADFTQKMATYAGSVMNPEEYGKQMASRLCPITLPYELGTAAAFDLAGFNGRPLGDDVVDVMLTLASNKPLQGGVAPDRNRIRTEFPYFGEPYSKEEQKDVVPWHPRTSHLGLVPDEVWEHLEIETLVLADNDLTEIPTKIGDLKHLRMKIVLHLRAPSWHRAPGAPRFKKDMRETVPQVRRGSRANTISAGAFFHPDDGKIPRR
jgi:hypothetical protein